MTPVHQVIDKYRANTPDLIVLDIMLPDMDGLGVLAQIRESETYTPTLFLTARDSVVDRVTGLTAGGDDYMTKPFSLEELVARLRGLLRRSAYLIPATDESLTVGDLELDAASQRSPRRRSDLAHVDRIRVAAVPDAQSAKGAEPRRDPASSVGLRLRWPVEHRRPLCPTPPRRSTRADGR